MSFASDTVINTSSDHESFNSSSWSSLSKEESLKVAYQRQLEKTQKLEAKICGYRTVVEQLPKYFGIIRAQRQKVKAYEKIIEQLKQEKAQYQLLVEQQRENLQKNNQNTAASQCNTTSRAGQFTPHIVGIEGDDYFTCVSEKSQTNEQQGLEKTNFTINEGVMTSHPEKLVNVQHCVGLQQGPQFCMSASGSQRPSSHVSDFTSLVKESSISGGNLRGISSLAAFPVNADKCVSVFARDKSSEKMSGQMEQTTKVYEQSVEGRSADGNYAAAFDSRHSATISQEPFQLSERSYGIGARPKEWKPLNTSNNIPAHPDIKDAELKHANKEQKFHMVVPELTNFEDIGGRKETLNSTVQLGQNPSFFGMRDTINYSTSEIQPLMHVSPSEDLMKFSSVNSTTQPFTDVKSTGEIASPSEEQTQLASMAENMAAVLKTRDSSAAMSDMLFRFAEEAKNMEAKLNNYQALIQRQQVQIQSLSKQNSSLEIQRLKEEMASLVEENETLFDVITTQRGSPENIQWQSWTSVLNNQMGVREPAGTTHPDSSVIKKLESLEKINARLFRANKDWHNKWEILRQQTQAEKEDLEAKVTSFTSEIESLQKETSTLRKQSQDSEMAKQEALQKLSNMEAEKMHQQRQLETLNTQVADLTRDKRRLESEIAALKNASRVSNREQAGNKKLETEISILKQQLTIFAEDFEKERRDRTAAENKAQKLKKEKDQIKSSLDSKLKKINVQLAMHENDLRTKARQNAELQYQVDSLKLELQREQRKSTLSAQHSFNPYLPVRAPGEPETQLFHNDETNSILPTRDLQTQTQHHSSEIGSPEHLPGAWQCCTCTYINFPNRTVCDICGQNHTAGQSSPIQASAFSQHELQSRGNEKKASFQDPDVVIDSL